MTVIRFTRLTSRSWGRWIIATGVVVVAVTAWLFVTDPPNRPYTAVVPLFLLLFLLSLRRIRQWVEVGGSGTVPFAARLRQRCLPERPTVACGPVRRHPVREDACFQEPLLGAGARSRAMSVRIAWAAADLSTAVPPTGSQQANAPGCSQTAWVAVRTAGRILA